VRENESHVLDVVGLQRKRKEVGFSQKVFSRVEMLTLKGRYSAPKSPKGCVFKLGLRPNAPPLRKSEAPADISFELSVSVINCIASLRPLFLYLLYLAKSFEIEVMK
jgi:hypothetical protein